MNGTETLTEFIKSGRLEELGNALEANPGLASQKINGISLLQFAAYFRNAEAVAIIRRFKNDIDAFEAAALGDTEQLTHHLIENSSVISDFSADGFTLLGLASYFGHPDIVNLLIEAGPDPNVPSSNDFKVAPLHSACAISNVAIAKILLDAGADVNAKQSLGVTPLHSAAHNGQAELATILITYGADVDAKTDQRMTPLQMALEKDHVIVADVIRNAGGK